MAGTPSAWLPTGSRCSGRASMNCAVPNPVTGGQRSCSGGWRATGGRPDEPGENTDKKVDRVDNAYARASQKMGAEVPRSRDYCRRGLADAVDCGSISKRPSCP